MNEGEWINEEEVEEGWYPPDEEGGEGSGESQGRAFAAGAGVRGALGSVGSGIARLFAPSEPEPTQVQAHLRRLPNRQPATPSTISLASLLPSQAVQPVVERGEDLSDLFEVPQPEDNDIYCDDLTDFTEEDAADLLEVNEEDIFGTPEEISDLLTVSRGDIINGRGKPKPKLMRTSRPYYPELTGLR